MKNRTTQTIGALLAVVGFFAAMSIFTIVGVRMVDRLLYRYGLESFTMAEQRCNSLVPPGLADSAERWRCLREELAKTDEPVLKGSFPLLVAAFLSSLIVLVGFALTFWKRPAVRNSL